MARVFVPDGPHWYEELKAVSYYGESELERYVRDHVADLFPDFFVFPFKKDVTHKKRAVTKRPDLAMVRRDLKSWGIIEVELSHHDLKHVVDQTGCFAEGSYNAPEIAEYIRKQIQEHCNAKVLLNKLEKLIDEELPSVLVVVDSHVEAWVAHLDKLHVGMCVFEIFKDIRGHFLYRTFGAYPTVSVREAHCRRHKSLPNVLEIIGDFKFKTRGKQRQVEIAFDETMTRWGQFEDAGSQFLQFLGKSNPLSPNHTYGLFADKAERYYFRAN